MRCPQERDHWTQALQSGAPTPPALWDEASFLQTKWSLQRSLVPPQLSRKEAREAGGEIQWWGSPARAELGHKRRSTRGPTQARKPTRCGEPAIKKQDLPSPYCSSLPQTIAVSDPPTCFQLQAPSRILLPLSRSANHLTLKQSQFLVRVQNEGAGSETQVSCFYCKGTRP